MHCDTMRLPGIGTGFSEVWVAHIFAGHHGDDQAAIYGDWTNFHTLYRWLSYHEQNINCVANYNYLGALAFTDSYELWTLKWKCLVLICMVMDGSCHCWWSGPNVFHRCMCLSKVLLLKHIIWRTCILFREKHSPVRNTDLWKELLVRILSLY